MENPRIRRLRIDFEKVQKLAVDSAGTLRLVRASGNPPLTYVVEYHCPSLVDANGEIAETHQVEIRLGSNYPLDRPDVRMLTPIFNPHVFPFNQAFCLGSEWSPASTLDTFLLWIGALLQLDPKVLNRNSPANSEANAWVQRNRSRLPLGQVTFKAPAEPPKRIQWSA